MRNFNLKFIYCVDIKSRFILATVFRPCVSPNQKFQIHLRSSSHFTGSGCVHIVSNPIQIKKYDSLIFFLVHLVGNTLWKIYTHTNSPQILMCENLLKMNNQDNAFAALFIIIAHKLFAIGVASAMLKKNPEHFQTHKSLAYYTVGSCGSASKEFKRIGSVMACAGACDWPTLCATKIKYSIK